MSRGRLLEPKDIVDIAEAALELGLWERGQDLIDAAYDMANGRTVQNLEKTIDSVSSAILRLTQRPAQ